MHAPCTEDVDLRVALAERDPETLVGPLLWLLTRLARPDTDADAAVRQNLACALTAHLTALAAHPAVDPELRLAAGALALEHRRCA